MLVLGQTLWIFLFFYVDFLLPLGCKATIETKEIWTKEDADGRDRFILKPLRRLLWRDNEPSWRIPTDHSSNSLDGTALVYIVIVVVIVILAALIKCCMKLANESDEEVSGVTVHPPPRNGPPTLSSLTSSRPLAPPRTSSRSLILLPEERTYHTLFIGIENPNYIPSPTSRLTEERINSNPTPILNFIPNYDRNRNSTTSLDLPPDYDSVVKADSQNTVLQSVTNYPRASSKKDTAEFLPKYDDSLDKQ